MATVDALDGSLWRRIRWRSPGSWKRWVLVLGALIVAAATVNLLMPIPDINDFRGLGMNCLLMERKGLRYCVNGNWGFANPLLCYLLTRVTGNLLVSQRTLTFMGAVLTLVFADRTMQRLFNVGAPVRTAFLLAMIGTPWMMEGLASTHMDILPIALTLAGLSMLRSTRWASCFLAGLLVSAASWFRFHFAAYAILYLVLMYFQQSKGRRLAVTAYAAAGVAAGMAVPMVLSELAFGVASVSNQKLIVAILMKEFAYTVPYQASLASMPLDTIVSHVNWVRLVFKRLFFAMRWTTFVLACVLFAVHCWQVRPQQPATGQGTPLWRRLWNCATGELTVRYVLYILASVALFLILRDFTVRLEAALFLVGFPWLAGIYSRRPRSLEAGLVAAIIVVAWTHTPDTLFNYLKMTQRFNDIDCQVRSVVPAEVALNSPEKVIDGFTDYPNRHDRYWLWNPVVIGGWMAGWKPFRQEFGTLDLGHPQLARDFPRVEYLLLASDPLSHFDFEQYAPSLVTSGRRYAEFKDVVIVETGGK